jgi:uncharacterized delta-60 repeat protein
MAVQADGRIVIVGSFASVNGVSRQDIARLNPDRSLDVTFDPGKSGIFIRSNGSPRIADLMLRPDGKILIAGSFTLSNTAPRTAIARLNPDGSLDESCGPAFSTNESESVVEQLWMNVDGKLLITGEFTAVNGLPRPNIARLYARGHQPSFPVRSRRLCGRWAGLGCLAH